MMLGRSSALAWGVQTLGEFLGTAMFLYLATGGVKSLTGGSPESSFPVGVAAAWGASLALTTWAFFRISGAHLNPAITLSSLITGHITVPKAILYFIAQLLGAMLGAALARATTPSSYPLGSLDEVMNGESRSRAFFLEFFLTSIMVFVYHMVVHEKNKSTFLAALPIGLAAFSCYLFGTRFTGTSINPARAFATSVVNRSFTSDHWIFWFGPLAGAVLGAALHILFRWVNYDHLNPGQDAESFAQYHRANMAFDPEYAAAHGNPPTTTPAAANGTTTDATMGTTTSTNV
ncbi:hypothetical protein BGZ73_002134 [Actinomortierella ambigua]|nr:hypothetical protein BGZ73_002134 [Actinomortierella ambigua]